MNKKTCPDCGFLNINGEHAVCPECGCPLSEVDVETAEPVPDPTENSQPAADKELSDAIKKDGCIDTWRSQRKNESQTARVTDILGSVFEGCAGVVGFTFLIMLIVKGIKYDQDYLMDFFYRSSRPFIIGVAFLYAWGKIFETISCNNELRNCTSWLRGEHLNTLYCLEISNYGMTKKNSIFYDDHKIEVAYCGAHPEYVKKCEKRRIIKCIVYVISAVLLAPSCYIFIEQLLLEVGYHSANWYLMIGFGGAMLLIEFINWLVRRILDKDFYEKNDTWLREGKTKKNI